MAQKYQFWRVLSFVTAVCCPGTWPTSHNCLSPFESVRRRTGSTTNAGDRGGHVPLLIIPVALLITLVLVALMPLTLVQRYRVGTSRREARRWVATINFVGVAVSVMLFLITAAITAMWVPNAFTYSVVGLAIGCALGVLGLAMSRWETTAHSLHYTPSRSLVLAITLVVLVRIVYGFWRALEAWRIAPGTASWLIASGAAGSLGAGALVLGYYLTFWGGVRHRITRHRRG